MLRHRLAQRHAVADDRAVELVEHGPQTRMLLLLGHAGQHLREGHAADIEHLGHLLQRVGDELDVNAPPAEAQQARRTHVDGDEPLRLQLGHHVPCGGGVYRAAHQFPGAGRNRGIGEFRHDAGRIPQRWSVIALPPDDEIRLPGTGTRSRYS